MKEEGRRLEVHKPRRESQGHRPTLGTSLLSAYSKAMWLHFFPQQPLVNSQPHFTPRVAALGSQWSLSPPTQTFVEAFRRLCC